jgi:hypothetical protein
MKDWLIDICFCFGMTAAYAAYFHFLGDFAFSQAVNLAGVIGALSVQQVRR